MGHGTGSPWAGLGTLAIVLALAVLAALLLIA